MLVEAGCAFGFAERPQEVKVSGKRWVCVDSSPYWMVSTFLD